MTADTVEQMRSAALTLTGWSSDDVSRKPDVAMGAISSISESLNRWADEIEARHVAQPPTVAEAARVIEARIEELENLCANAERRGPSHRGYVTDATFNSWCGQRYGLQEALRALTKEGDAG